MNKNTETENKPRRLFRINEKIKDVLFIGGLALALVFAAWKIFYTDEQKESFSSVSVTANEEKIGRLLSEIDGVGEADVMICETEDGVSGVVVVCEGANDFQVVIRVREAVAAALGTEEKTVKIYLKKE